jgi:hypothetical protein
VSSGVVDKHSDILGRPQKEFRRRFQISGSRKRNSTVDFSFPFEVVKARDSLQLELTDLESNKGLKQKLKSVKCVDFVLLVCDPEYWKGEALK